MTIDELNTLIEGATWFSKLGEPDVPSEYVRISTLAPWGNQQAADEALKQIAEQMEWLPSSLYQDDPIHGRFLEQRAEAQGRKQEFTKQVSEAYGKTLALLRRFEGTSALKVGPHDFTGAARGAALFAVRRAAFELLLV